MDTKDLVTILKYALINLDDFVFLRINESQLRIIQHYPDSNCLNGGTKEWILIVDEI